MQPTKVSRWESGHCNDLLWFVPFPEHFIPTGQSMFVVGEKRETPRCSPCSVRATNVFFVSICACDVVCSFMHRQLDSKMSTGRQRIALNRFHPSETRVPSISGQQCFHESTGSFELHVTNVTISTLLIFYTFYVGCVHSAHI